MYRGRSQACCRRYEWIEKYTGGLEAENVKIDVGIRKKCEIARYEIAKNSKKMEESYIQ